MKRPRAKRISCAGSTSNGHSPFQQVHGSIASRADVTRYEDRLLTIGNLLVLNLAPSGLCRKVIDFRVETEEAWRTVVLNRWPIGKLCAACFDAEAEKAKVRYSFVNVVAQSGNEQACAKQSIQAETLNFSRHTFGRVAL